jgi:hypothetical protein
VHISHVRATCEGNVRGGEGGSEEFGLWRTHGAKEAIGDVEVTALQLPVEAGERVQAHVVVQDDARGRGVVGAVPESERASEGMVEYNSRCRFCASAALLT